MAVVRRIQRRKRNRRAVRTRAIKHIARRSVKRVISPLRIMRLRQLKNILRHNRLPLPGGMHGKAHTKRHRYRIVRIYIIVGNISKIHVGNDWAGSKEQRCFVVIRTLSRSKYIRKQRGLRSTARKTSYLLEPIFHIVSGNRIEKTPKRQSSRCFVIAIIRVRNQERHTRASSHFDVGDMTRGVVDIPRIRNRSSSKYSDKQHNKRTSKRFTQLPRIGQHSLPQN